MSTDTEGELDQLRLTYCFHGLDVRLTNQTGKVVKALLARAFDVGPLVLQ